MRSQPVAYEKDRKGAPYISSSNAPGSPFSHPSGREKCKQPKAKEGRGRARSLPFTPSFERNAQTTLTDSLLRRNESFIFHISISWYL